MVSWLLIARGGCCLGGFFLQLKGFPLAWQASAFQWPGILTRARAHGSRMASPRSATCFPCLMGRPERVPEILFPKHTKIMCRSQTTAAVRADTGRLSSQRTHPVSLINSACWAEETLGKGPFSRMDTGDATAQPAWYSPEVLVSMNHQ